MHRFSSSINGKKIVSHKPLASTCKSYSSSRFHRNYVIRMKGQVFVFKIRKIQMSSTLKMKKDAWFDEIDVAEISKPAQYSSFPFCGRYTDYSRLTISTVVFNPLTNL